MSTATECSTVKTESISHDQPPNTPVSMNSSVLASSLSTDRLENPGVVSVFWETVWPILESAGWEKRVSCSRTISNNETINSLLAASEFP